jgi:carbonic anhydrase
MKSPTQRKEQEYLKTQEDSQLILENLIQGYQKFRFHYFQSQNLLYEQFLHHGQRPQILVIACSDSRVDPAILFHCDPGDLFVIRNVANLVPPYEENDGYHGTSAALEFGVCTLQVQHIIVLGHTQCGGIRTLTEPESAVNPKSGFIAKWMQLADSSYHYVCRHHAQVSREEQADLCGQYSLIDSWNHLKTFPWIETRVRQQSLHLHAWYFDLTSGRIQCLDPQSRKFILLEEQFKTQSFAVV